VFAPVAGALAGGVSAGELGPEVEDFVRLPLARPERDGEGALVASIIHVDRFGNCVTNITRQDLTDEEITRGARLLVGGREVRSFRRFFAEEGDRHSEPFAVWGSAGFLELAVFRDSAARVLGAGRGQKIKVTAAASSGL